MGPIDRQIPREMCFSIKKKKKKKKKGPCRVNGLRRVLIVASCISANKGPWIRGQVGCA